MPEGVDTAIEEAHGELSLARVALADDDLHHAAGHLAGAIAHAPGLPEVHELLAVLAARSADGGLGLFPLEQRNFIGTVVARAHLLAGAEPERALTMLAQATAYEPGKPWADVAWVRVADVAAMDPQVLIRVLTTVMRPVGDPATGVVRDANQVYLDLARRALAAHPGDSMLHATAAGLGRRLGATAEAVRWGERAVRLEPSKLALVWYAYALKADGRLAAGLDVLRDACRRFPLDLDLCADLAEWLAEADRLDEALAVAEEAVTVDESYDCVVHTLHRLRFWQDGDPRHLIALADYLRAHPAADHEHRDLERCCQGRNWLGRPAAVGAARRRPPTAERPAPASAELLRELVTPSWADPVSAYDHALPLGELPLTELLAVLAHPPRPRDDFAEFPPGWWERCAQAFACLGILHCRELAGDHPGDTARRRRVLTELAGGDLDQIAEAALFALVVAAWTDPGCRDEVNDTVGRRLADAVDASRVRPAGILRSLVHLARITPGMRPEALDVAESVLDTPPAAAPKKSFLRRLFRR